MNYNDSSALREDNHEMDYQEQEYSYEFEENYYSYIVAKSNPTNKTKQKTTNMNKNTQNKKAKETYVGIKPAKSITRRMKLVMTTIIYSLFVLFAIMYYNSFVNVKFLNNQELRKELTVLQKENEQLVVNIEKKLNYSNVEQMAHNMRLQKLSSSQIQSLSLPKKDLIQIGYDDIIEEEETKMQRILRHIFN